MKNYKEIFFEADSEEKLKVARSLVTKGALEEVTIGGKVRFRFTDAGIKKARQLFGN